MKQSLLIDGYNLAHKLGLKISRETLDMARQTLEQKLQQFLSKQKVSITVVYDGRGILGNSAGAGQLRLIYTPSGESADARIKQLIDETRTKAHLTVISSDHEVSGYARVSGVKTLTSEDFLRQLEGAVPKPSAAKTAETLDSEKPAALSAKELGEWKRLFDAYPSSDNGNQQV